MNIISRITLKLKLRFMPAKLSSIEYIQYLREHDIAVGKGTVFYGAAPWTIDTQRPWLISIGEYCKITRGVTILSHDYSRSVLRRAYGEVLGEARETVIGNNVFIGINSTILMGARIGNNVIIGAGSVVSGVVPDNVVVAGNPAKIIRTLDEHHQVRKAACVMEARECASMFFARHGRKPTIREMGAFFPLYLERDLEALRENGIATDLGGDEQSEIEQAFLNSAPIYASFEEFLDSVDFHTPSAFETKV